MHMTLKASDFLSLLGAAVSDESINALWPVLDTLRRPALPDDNERFHDWVLVRRKGIELGFSDAEYHEAADGFRWGTGELIFTQIYFYAGMEEVEPFRGELPYGLSFSDSRIMVREKMAAFEASRHSHVSDTWDVDDRIRLNVMYGADHQSIDRMACLHLAAPIAPSLTVKPPSMTVLADHFGDPLTREAVSSLWPDGWDEDDYADASDDGELVLTTTYGATVSYAGKRGKASLRSVSLHGNRDLEFTQWRGELPGGLTFDDSPETLFAKFAELPAHQHDDTLSGYAVWHLPDYTVHVLYSNLYNRLLRVSVIAPGTWKSVRDLDDFA